MTRPALKPSSCSSPLPAVASRFPVSAPQARTPRSQLAVPDSRDRMVREKNFAAALRDDVQLVWSEQFFEARDRRIRCEQIRPPWAFPKGLEAGVIEEHVRRIRRIGTVFE